MTSRMSVSWKFTLMGGCCDGWCAGVSGSGGGSSLVVLVFEVAVDASVAGVAPDDQAAKLAVLPDTETRTSLSERRTSYGWAPSSSITTRTTFARNCE